MCRVSVDKKQVSWRLRDCTPKDAGQLRREAERHTVTRRERRGGTAGITRREGRDLRIIIHVLMKKSDMTGYMRSTSVHAGKSKIFF